MASLIDIASQLEAPFPLDIIELLPKGKLERDGKTLCMGMPYADVRVYEDRLNSLACGEWSTPPCTAVVAGNKLLTYVTVVVCGVPHTDVGEALTTSENGGTEAWAQGFKRACSQFGLGRYLYDLDKEWVPYNVQRKVIDLDAAGICNVARKMYQKAGISVPGQIASQQSNNASNPRQLPQPKKLEDIPSASQLREVSECLFPGKWEEVKKRVLKADVADGELSPDQCARIHGTLLQSQAKAAKNNGVGSGR